MVLIFISSVFILYDFVFMEKPKLTIETTPKSTGNEGLDKEREWRDKSGMCEHKDRSRYVAHEGDIPLECDVADDNVDKRKSNNDENAYPDKHLATEKAGDSTWICNDCHIIICDNCTQEYSDSSPDTTTASQAEFPLTNKKESESNPEKTNEVDSDKKESESNTEEPDEVDSEMPSFLDMDE